MIETDTADNILKHSLWSTLAKPTDLEPNYMNE